MRLRRYLLARILQLVPVLLVVVVLNFVLIHLAPGDVTLIMAGENPDPEYMAAIRQRFGLDQPLHIQLFTYISRVLQLDLGYSFRYSQPVLSIIVERIPATLLLVLSSMALAAVVGTLVGTATARRAGTRTDAWVSGVAVGTYSIPVFWLGLMLILFFSLRLGWFPPSGMTNVIGVGPGLARYVDICHHLILPMMALSTVWFGQYVRIARSSVLQVLSEDFVTTARAIGYPERQVLFGHVLRNALLPIVTVLGVQLGLVLGGAVLTETVFAWPGLGQLVYDAVLARDTPLIIGVYVVMGVCVVASSLIVDLVYAILDPRVDLHTK
jgi:peptide/nickel transport system permease protein